MTRRRCRIGMAREERSGGAGAQAQQRTKLSVVGSLEWSPRSRRSDGRYRRPTRMSISIRSGSLRPR